MAKNRLDNGLFRRGRRWWLALYVKGEGKKNIPLRPEGQTHATTDLNVARVLADIARKQADAQGMDWLLKQFAVVNAVEGSPAQAKDNVAHIKAFLGEFTITIDGEKTDTIRPAAYPRQITTQRVQSWLVYLRQAGRSPKTAWNHKASISAFCEFLIDRDQLQTNPCRRVKIGKLRKLLPRFLNDDDYEQVLKLAKDHGILAEVETALQTGMRREELRRMAWADVDFKRSVVAIPESKSRRPRAIPMNDRLLAVLLEQQAQAGKQKYVFPGRERKDHTGMRRGSWWVSALKPLQDALPIFRAGMADTATGRGWHLFRHTFASRLVQAGVPIAKVSAWLGHASITTTMIYAHLTPGHDADIEKA
jgi:integrase